MSALLALKSKVVDPGKKVASLILAVSLDFFARPTSLNEKIKKPIADVAQKRGSANLPI